MSLRKSTYQCAECLFVFEEPNNYDDNPATRDCPRCNNAQGQIMLLGRKSNLYVVSDDLGIKGVVNPVNGKPYDSKSQYYRDVKASGMEIVGTDAPTTTKSGIKGDYDCKADIAQAIEQTGAMGKLKRKKK